MRSPFRGIDLSRLEAVGSEVRAAAGQLLTERGHPGSGLYLIVEGSVRVEAPERTRHLGPGSAIGEQALLWPNGLRTARVQATTDVRALAIARDDFEGLCKDDPTLGSRLAAATDAPADRSGRDIWGRVRRAVHATARGWPARAARRALGRSGGRSRRSDRSVSPARSR